MMPTLILLSDDDGMHELVTTGIFPSSLSVSAKNSKFCKNRSQRRFTYNVLRTHGYLQLRPVNNHCRGKYLSGLYFDYSVSIALLHR